MAIEPGDIVEPRCGGPPMKVRFVAKKFALCSWVDLTRGRRRVDLFRLDALVILDRVSDQQLGDQAPEDEDL